MRAVFNDPFEAEGRWFKGNLHTHTTNSDGEMSTETIAKSYKEAGYDFISISDHGKLTPTWGLSTPDFLLIAGEEMCVGASEAGRFFHIVGVDIRDPLPIEDFDRDATPQTAIDSVIELGGSPIVAHPYWSELNHFDLVGLRGYLGIEVYNTNCDLTIGRGLSSVHWDGLLSSGERLLGFAVDDAHSRSRAFLPNDWCRAWIMVKATDLTVEGVMEGIRKGLFYSSNGPELRSIEIEDDRISVATSSVMSISFVSNAAMGEKNTAETSFLEEAAYVLRGNERYVRIEATDRDGRRAWSNPIFVEP